MTVVKGKFVLGSHTYYWRAIIDGVHGYGKTKRQAIANANAERLIYFNLSQAKAQTKPKEQTK